MKTSGRLNESFREIQVLFSRFYTTILNQYDLSLPQYALLSLLATSGLMTMTQASRKLHLSKPAITNLVDRLEETRFIKRFPHAKDRRIHLLKTLSKGRNLVRKIQNRALSLPLRTLSSFKAHEQKTVVHFYQLLSQNIIRALGEKRKKR
ncbi:MAG: MarR family transcriptional regulator [Candidatus Omnitrophica bacterium]|nr:MarR family transcriptional regulator [Candidatus Omnitrophota bacterium]